MHGTIGPVSVARCAELLSANGDKIDRSALSRYCDAHGLKGERVGREVKVNYEAVAAHRAANYTREVMSGAALEAPAVPVAAAPAQADLGLIAPAATAPAMSPTAQIASMAEHRGLKAVQLRQALRDEAKAEGLLTVVAEVEAGIAEAIVEMRTVFANVNEDVAERLAAELGLPPERVRVVRAAFKRFAQLGQERFAARMAKAVAAGNEPAGEVRDRLKVLAANAVRLRAGRADPIDVSVYAGSRPGEMPG
jgi:hypothetical protein